MQLSRQIMRDKPFYCALRKSTSPKNRIKFLDLEFYTAAQQYIVYNIFIIYNLPYIEDRQ